MMLAIELDLHTGVAAPELEEKGMRQKSSPLHSLSQSKNARSSLCQFDLFEPEKKAP